MHSQGLQIALIALIATGLMAAEPSTEDLLKKDMVGIQGTWKIVSLECDCEQSPPEVVAALRLVFKADTLTFRPGEPGFTNYKYKLDPAQKPARFDITHADGAQQGETQKGIYLLEGDRLKICFDREDGRPKEFTAKLESGQTLYTLIRHKP